MNTEFSTPAAPRTLDSSRGLAWWTDAWALFTRAAGMWVVLGLLMMVMFILMAVIPVLGSLAAALLTPPFVAGWMLAARKVQGGGTLEIGDLFSGFGDKLSPLLVLGGVFLAGTAVIVLVMMTVGAGAVLAGMAGGGSGGSILAAAGAGFTALLLGLVLGAVLAMAFWFAPGLVLFRGMPPLEALQASLRANLRNILPFIVYALIYLVASIVASIPFGLGWVVLVPVLLLSIHTSYEDVFPG